MKYGFQMYQMKVEDHVFWVAESKSLKGCVGQGDTVAEAVQELETNEIDWIETAQELSMAIPEPTVESLDTYSGKFVVRVSPVIHKEASECAKKQGISLNQYVNNAILTANVSNITTSLIDQKLNELAREFRSMKTVGYGRADMFCEDTFEYNASAEKNNK